MHACFVADSLNIPRIIVPANAGVASALGATTMDLRQDLEAFYFSSVEDADLTEVNQIFADLESRAIELLIADDVARDQIETSRSAQMRYVGQTYEVETPFPDTDLSAQDVPPLSRIGIRGEFG